MLGIGVVPNLPDNEVDFHSLLLEARRYPGSRGGTKRLCRCALTAVLVALSSQGSQTEESQAKQQAYLHMGRGHAGKYSVQQSWLAAWKAQAERQKGGHLRFTTGYLAITTTLWRVLAAYREEGKNFPKDPVWRRDAGRKGISTKSRGLRLFLTPNMVFCLFLLKCSTSRLIRVNFLVVTNTLLGYTARTKLTIYYTFMCVRQEWQLDGIY